MANPFDDLEPTSARTTTTPKADTSNPFDNLEQQAFATATSADDDPYAMLVKIAEKSASPRDAQNKSPRGSDLAKRPSDLSKRGGSDLGGTPPKAPVRVIAEEVDDDSPAVDVVALEGKRDSSMDWDGIAAKEREAKPGVVKKLAANVIGKHASGNEPLQREESPTLFDGDVDWAAEKKKGVSLAKKLSSSLLRKQTSGDSRGRTGSQNSLDDIGERVNSSGGDSDSSGDDSEAGGLPFGPTGDHHDLTGRNRIIQFMETAAGPEQGKVQCVVVVADDVYEFHHLSSRRVWMKAKRRSDGLKTFMPGETHFAIWLTPLLLVESMKGKEEDTLSLGDLLRQLDTVELFENDLKQDTPLRLGKLRGNARGMYRLWGTGKSSAKASGAMDARPEFACVKLEQRNVATLVLPCPTNSRIRPMKKHEFLWARADKGDKAVSKIVGQRSATLCEWDDGKTVLRVAKAINQDKRLLVEFCNMSPYQAFGVALACAASMGVKTVQPSSRGSLQNLLGERKNSARKDSKGDLLTS